MQAVVDRHRGWRDLDDAQQTIALQRADPRWLRAQFEAISDRQESEKGG